MTILKKLKRALDWDTEDYKSMPDYSDIIDYLGMDEDDHPNDILDAIEAEVEALEAEPDADPDGGADVS